MIKIISYKKKNILLLAGTFLFSVLIYYFSIERTIELVKLCSNLEQQLLVAENAPKRLAELKMQLGQITVRLGNEGKFGGDVQQALLEQITHYCNENNLVLKEFPQPLVSREQDYIVETNIIVVEGGFSKLLKLIYQLEQVKKTGKVAAVYFKSKEDLKSKKLILTASLYLQNIKKS